MATKSRCSAPASTRPGHPCMECRVEDRVSLWRKREETRDTSYGENTTDDLLTAADASEESLHVPHISAVAACRSENWEDVTAHGPRAQEWSTSHDSGVAGRVRRTTLFGLDLWADQLGAQSAGGGRSRPHA